MARIAFLTIGVLKEPMGHPSVQGFSDRIGPVFSAADRCDGYIGRAEFDAATDTFSWGEFVVPPAFGMDPDPNLVPSTLSLWEDLESVVAFAYHGPHAEALQKRHEWIVSQGFPAYVAWWVDDGHTPDFKEASQRYQHLYENGPTPYGFDFKSPFNPAGMPCPLDSISIRAKAKLNGMR